MDWLNFKGAIQFGKPAGWDEKRHGACGTLPVRMGEHQGIRTYSSYWRPTEVELANLLAGGCIEVCLYGVQPAMSMLVHAKLTDEVPGA